MPFFTCSACTEPIPVTKARIRCQICKSDYELCANCFVVGKSTLNHQVSHETVLFITSGHDLAELKNLVQPSVAVLNPLSRGPLGPKPEVVRRPLIAAPVLPPRPGSQTYFPPPPPPLVQQSHPNTQQSPVQQQSTPSPYQPSPSTTSRSPVLSSPAPSSYAQYTPPPPQSPHPSQQSTPQPNPQAQTPNQWQPLTEDAQPSPICTALFTAILERVDVNRTGLLTPEQYSAFLDVQQYKLEEDVWKKSLKPTFGYNPEDLADFELRTTYENFSIEHVLKPRVIAPSTDFAHVVGSSSLPAGIVPTSLPPISGGMMPMLSLKGFIDITFIEIFCDDTALGWQRLNMLLNHYQVWRSLGDVPRSMFPPQPPPELLQRVGDVSAQAQRKAVEMIDANKVKLELQAMGRQNALDLTDPPGTRYVYRY